MDRDLLSDATVVAASEGLVCARLLTYESAPEAEFLLSIFSGRTGALENTVCAVLSPDGVTPLSRAGRSFEMVFGGRGEDAAAKAATEMGRIAARFPAKPGTAAESPLLPYLVDARRALDAAACDMLPLAVVVAKDDATRLRLEKDLRPLAWSDDFRGRFEWVAAAPGDLVPLASVRGTSPLVVLHPDAFGRKGTVLAQATDASSAALRAALARALARHDPGHKDYRDHVHDGHVAGVEWETEIPVTDPDSLRGPPPR
jgi:hypothetical protein